MEQELNTYFISERDIYFLFSETLKEFHNFLKDYLYLLDPGMYVYLNGYYFSETGFYLLLSYFKPFFLKKVIHQYVEDIEKSKCIYEEGNSKEIIFAYEGNLYTGYTLLNELKGNVTYIGDVLPNGFVEHHITYLCTSKKKYFLYQKLYSFIDMYYYPCKGRILIVDDSIYGLQKVDKFLYIVEKIG